MLISFNNILRQGSLRRSAIEVSPPVADLRIEMRERGLVFREDFREGRRYTVTLSPGCVSDLHGQTLRRPVTLVVNTTPLDIKAGARQSGPYVDLAGGPLVTVDPRDADAWPIGSGHTHSIRVQAWKVTPSDWPRFAAITAGQYGHLHSWRTRGRGAVPRPGPSPRPQRAGDESELPGKRVLDRSLSVRTRADVHAVTLLDLRPLLTNGCRHLIVRVSAPGAEPRLVWLQASRLVADVAVGPRGMMAWVTSLDHGRPVAGATISLLPGQQTAVTNGDGLGSLSLDKHGVDPENALVVQAGDDSLIVRDLFRSRDIHDFSNRLLWHVYDDRRLYRPGDEVHVKGWVRNLRRTAGDDLELPGKGVQRVHYKLMGLQDDQEVILSGACSLDSTGAFDTALRLPASILPGSFLLTLQATDASGMPAQADGSQTTHFLQVEEVRRPAFHAAVTVEGGTHLAGDPFVASAEARYYGGGALTHVPVKWSASTAWCTYQPPGHDDFRFAPPADWPVAEQGDGSDEEGSRMTQAPAAFLRGQCDATGRHSVRIHCDGTRRPVEATLQATVVDSTSQAQSAHATTIVHPASLYVGLRPEARFWHRDQPVKMSVVVTDPAGRSLEGKEVRLRWWREGERVAAPEVDEDDGRLCGYEDREEQSRRRRANRLPACNRLDLREMRVRSRSTPVEIELPVGANGIWNVQATAEDEQGRTNESGLAFQVHDQYITRRPTWDDPLDDNMLIVADRRTYRPGETARLLVRLPGAVSRESLADGSPLQLSRGSRQPSASLPGAAPPGAATPGGAAIAVGQSPPHPGQASSVATGPSAPVEGLLVLSRSGVMETRRFVVNGPTTVVEVPINDGFVPSVEATVLFAGECGSRPQDDPRDAWGCRMVHLYVEPVTRKLEVITRCPGHARPGQATTLALEVRDHGGRPAAGAQVTVAVVDQSLLDLASYNLKDPLRSFYQARRGDLNWVGSMRPLQNRDAQTRDLPRITVHFVKEDLRAVLALLASEMDCRIVMDQTVKGTVTMSLVDVPVLGAMSMICKISGFGFKIVDRTVVVGSKETCEKIPDSFFKGDPGAMPHRPPSPELARPHLRSDMRPLAAFYPSVRTDEQGRARVTIHLPGTLTKYRVLAVAAAGARQFGTSDTTTIDVSLPLAVRVTPPRFANAGDVFRLPVSVQNQTGEPVEASVALRAGGIRLLEPGGRRVRIPGSGRVEMSFACRADATGPAAIQVIAATEGQVDATQAVLPVQQPATSLSFVASGTLGDRSLAIPLQVPRDALPDLGDLRVSLSSRRARELLDSLDFFASYRWGCTEQTASRILTQAALLGELARAQDEPTRRRLASVKRELSGAVHTLVDRQRPDGRFGLWSREGFDWPFASVHAVHALAYARARGVVVPAGVLQRSRKYLESLQPDATREPRDLRGETILASYALYVRSLLGDHPVPEARRMIEARGPARLPSQAVGWLLPVVAGDDALAKALHDALAARLQQSPARAWFTERLEASDAEDDGEVVASPTVDQAVLLHALVNDPWAAPFVAKLAREVLEARAEDKRSTTTVQATAVVALQHYFSSLENAGGRTTARAWLDDALLGEARLGDEGGEHEFAVPTSALTRSATSRGGHDSVPATRVPRRLVLTREGKGPACYHVALRCFWPVAGQPADERGFRVTREYLPLDDPATVRRDADGTWRITSGARVRVRVTVDTRYHTRQHVAVSDPLPAGFEPIVEGLGGSEQDPPGGAARQPLHPWDGFDHRALRDNCSEAFSRTMWGQRELEYTVRATTRGTFCLPPASVEEMYHPEVSGHSSAGRVVVE